MIQSTRNTISPALAFLIFTIDGVQLAMSLLAVEQVCSAVEITPLPSAPESILGLVNVHGSIVVVLNLRKKLKLKLRDVELSDQLLIATHEERQFALLVDDVVGVVHVKHEEFKTTLASNGRETVSFKTDTIPETVIFELNKFLSEEEEERLNEALYIAFLES